MTMLLETKYFGETEIVMEKIIRFPSGLPGFNEEQQFVLLDIPGNELVQLLQSVRTPDVSFFITNPHQYFGNYTFQLTDSILEALKIRHEKEIVILSIMTIQQPFSSSTLNLKAPIIMNAKERLGKQLILDSDHYPLKAQLASQAVAMKGEKMC